MGVPDEEAADIDDLPAFTYVDSGEAVLKPCAEIFMPERGIDAVSTAASCRLCRTGTATRPV